jgi:hypothetical protein
LAFSRPNTEPACQPTLIRSGSWPANRSSSSE